jgi:DNA repair protein RadC
MKHIITHPAAARPLLKNLAHRPVEEIWTLALGPTLELIALDRTFRGTRDKCLFHPREVFEFILRKRATNFILAHNHPSGSARPSIADHQITRRMIFLSQTLQIPMVDHLIVAQTELYSFRQNHRILFEKFPVMERYTDDDLSWISKTALTEPLPPWTHDRARA